MSGFDPRKYHGRRVDEVVRSVNGGIRSVLEEARAVYQLCLRQKNLPTHRKGWVRMQLWQVEKQLGSHSRYFSQAGQDRYLNERIFRNRRGGTFVEIGGYDGWTGSNWFDSRLRAVEIAFAKVDQRLATLERAIIPAAPPAE